jgi:hypothetical protein
LGPHPARLLPTAFQLLGVNRTGGFWSDTYWGHLKLFVERFTQLTNDPGRRRR